MKVGQVYVIGAFSSNPTWSSKGTLLVLAYVLCAQTFDDDGLLILFLRWSRGL